MQRILFVASSPLLNPVYFALSTVLACFQAALQTPVLAVPAQLVLQAQVHLNPDAWLPYLLKCKVQGGLVA